MSEARYSTAAAMLLCFASICHAVTIEGTWRYTTADPGKGWTQGQLKDPKDCPQWKRGKGGFGMPGTPGGRIHTHWGTPDIWMRSTYVLKKGTDASRLSLEVCHDEDFEVYINGVLAARATGYITDYRLFAISPKARRALKVGKNTIAVHCHQTAGGQYIDVGFTSKKKARVSSHRSKRIPPRPAVDTKYSKKATWPETMLAVRAANHVAKAKIDMNLGSAVAAEFWRDFPHETDWLMQDSDGKMSEWIAGYRDGKGDVMNYLKPDRDASLERKLIEKALAECGPDGARLRKELDALVSGASGPDDRRWLGLYAKACRVRRARRLAPLLAKTRQVLFARHHNMGGGFFAYTNTRSGRATCTGGCSSWTCPTKRRPTASSPRRSR